MRLAFRIKYLNIKSIPFKTNFTLSYSLSCCSYPYFTLKKMFRLLVHWKTAY